MEFAGKLILPMDIKPDPSRRRAHECWLRASNSGEEDGKKTSDTAQTTKSSEVKNHPAQSSLTLPVTTAAQVACLPISKNVAFRHSSGSALRTAGVLPGQSKVRTT